MKQQLMNLFIRMQPFFFRLARKHGPQPFVYLESFHGKQVNDNPKMIYDALQARGIACVFGANKHYVDRFEKAGVPYVVRFSKKWYQAVACACVWVINTRTKSWIEKSPWTYYLNTWHGTPLKKLGLDIQEVNIAGETTDKYHQSIKKECRLWDGLIAPSDYAARCFQSAFALEEATCLKIGYPRNDLLVMHSEEKAAHIKKALGLDEKTTVFLYAPTWRDQQKEKGQYQFQLPFDLDRVLTLLPKESVLLVRMHYLVSESFDFTKYHSRICDVSNYPEMNELLLISDCLITDYSSSFFDYALLNRPILFYMYDKESYIQEIRGTYFSLEELPSTPVLEEEAFYQALDKISRNEAWNDEEKMAAFQNKFNQYEIGEAALQLADFIEEKIKERI